MKVNSIPFYDEKQMKFILLNFDCRKGSIGMRFYGIARVHFKAIGLPFQHGYNTLIYF